VTHEAASSDWSSDAGEVRTGYNNPPRTGWTAYEGSTTDISSPLEGLDVSLKVVRKAPAPFLSLGLVLSFLLPAVGAIAETCASLEVFSTLPADIRYDLLHMYNITYFKGKSAQGGSIFLSM
jgi:hypothetical protein